MSLKIMQCIDIILKFYVNICRISCELPYLYEMGHHMGAVHHVPDLVFDFEKLLKVINGCLQCGSWDGVVLVIREDDSTADKAKVGPYLCIQDVLELIHEEDEVD